MDRSTAERLMQLYAQAGELFNRATAVISELPDQQEQKGLRRPLGMLMAHLWTELQHPIVKDFPDLDPDKEVLQADPVLTADESARVAQLTESDIRRIDEALVAAASANWRKVARVVASAMNESTHGPGIPDIYYASRVRALVEAGRLESQGNLEYMRFSEVRLPAQSSSSSSCL